MTAAATKSNGKGDNGENKVQEMLSDFVTEVQPIESLAQIVALVDKMTDAHYCECHIKASKLVALGTTDVPLDPDEQPEYRANREIVQNHHAFEKMKDDAKNGRTFSNIVAEYTKDFEPERPIKIIGGQHRFEAISEAIASGVDEYHGIKVYMLLNNEQRLDVQLISNTNIAASADLVDRMQETMRGPDLRDWCQGTGLLKDGQDFTDKRERRGPISVQMARTFITNYYLGKTIEWGRFSTTKTAPVLCPTGQHDADWDDLVKTKHKELWQDDKLLEAGKEFAALMQAQRAFFAGRSKIKPDYPEKAMNIAILAAWAYVAGMLHDNHARLKRHYALRNNATTKDPLNAPALTDGRHKSDPQNYRGLGYRTDSKERERFVELFYNQAESGKGITPATIDIAIKQYHAKQAQLEVIKAKEQQPK
jgi:hypothetical protein